MLRTKIPYLFIETHSYLTLHETATFKFANTLLAKLKIKNLVINSKNNFNKTPIENAGEHSWSFLARLAFSLLKPRSCNTFQPGTTTMNVVKFPSKSQFLKILSLIRILSNLSSLALLSIKIVQPQYCLAFVLFSISIALLSTRGT